MPRGPPECSRRSCLPRAESGRGGGRRCLPRASRCRMTHTCSSSAATWNETPCGPAWSSGPKSGDGATPAKVTHVELPHRPPRCGYESLRSAALRTRPLPPPHSRVLASWRSSPPLFHSPSSLRCSVALLRASVPPPPTNNQQLTTNNLQSPPLTAAHESGIITKHARSQIRPRVTRNRVAVRKAAWPQPLMRKYNRMQRSTTMRAISEINKFAILAGFDIHSSALPARGFAALGAA